MSTLYVTEPPSRANKVCGTGDPLPRPKSLDAAAAFTLTMILTDLIVARPLLRKLELAMNRSTWELCVLMDYTYTSPNISLQPLSHLDNPKHPFNGGRKYLPEGRLHKNRGRLTALLTKMPAEQAGGYVLEAFLAHYILGPDMRTTSDTRFMYSEPFQLLLMRQPEDSAEEGTVTEAIRSLRGSGRKPTQKQERSQRGQFSGVLAH